MFTDTVTIYHKISDSEWERSVVKGVQWSDHEDKKNDAGRISVARYTAITFPEGTYEKIALSTAHEEDCIVLGVVDDEVEDVKGKRISDLLRKYPQSGMIQSVNDNSKRRFLKNIKVVLA